jgi:hypothetical protein
MNIIARMMTTLLVFVSTLFNPHLAIASTQPLPIKWEEIQLEEAQGFKRLKLPDWSKITLANLPGILTSGSISNEFNQLVGYDLSRVWNIGDTPDKILKLGDLAEALAPQNFTLVEISQVSGINWSDFTVDQFPLVGQQTLQQLVDAIPNLGSILISQIEPVMSLLSQQSLTFNNQTLSELLSLNSQLANLKLNQIDLSRFGLDTIPNLENAILANFNNWQSSLINQIPGLGQILLSKMPNPLTKIGNVVARIDSIWGAAEAQRNDTISGSYEQGFSVSCTKNCGYLELDDLENMGASVRVISLY